MWPESPEAPKPLRTGLTTGCCATACCLAAASALLTGRKIDVASVTLPRGNIVELTICEQWSSPVGAFAATIKDAGDDPDVTHGAKIFVNVQLSAHSGVVFEAGFGVGRVTREGLVLPVGAAAINPVPRQMMNEHLQRLAHDNDYHGGFVVTVGVEKGDELALKTMNPRLGIMGGLSILGTTGIVRPFSCSAYIASIHQGIDVAKANGFEHIAATTGSTSEAAIVRRYQLPEMALIEMGDFVGAVLKYMKKVPIQKLSICGGFGKMSKLANGHLDLHSRASSIDFNSLARFAAGAGGSPALQRKIMSANTSIEALRHCNADNVDLASAVCAGAWGNARAKIPATVELEVWAADRQGNLLACATGSSL